MEKKKIIIASSIILVLAIVLIIKINMPVEYPDKPMYFTPEPETWIEEQILTEENNDAKINVMKATKGDSVFEGNRQIYHLEYSDEAFFSYGSYNGLPFTSYYEKDNIKLIEISPSLDPDDGIIQIFILAKNDVSGFIFYIFVDDDWKNQLEHTNIIYGRDFSIPITLTSKPYNFEEIKPGIYMDSITDYNNWYDEDPVTGGILVGEINTEDLDKNQINSTYIMLR